MGPEQGPGIGLCFQHPELAVRATCRKIGSYGHRYLGTVYSEHTYVAQAIKTSIPRLVQIELEAREKRKKQWQNSKNGKNL